MIPECFFASYADTRCEGRLVRAHLFPLTKQLLKRRGIDEWDERAWVWCCGGYGYGNEAHHGLVDAGRLAAPLEELPGGFLSLVAELGLRGRLERVYGAAA